MVNGKDFRLADEVRYIQRRAAEHDSRVVSIDQVVLFSSESGDAWMLDPFRHLAVRLASDGYPQPIHIEETETTFTVTGILCLLRQKLLRFAAAARPRMYPIQVTSRWRMRL
jgi:hypothetical protein